MARKQSGRRSRAEDLIVKYDIKNNSNVKARDIRLENRTVYKWNVGLKGSDEWTTAQIGTGSTYTYKNISRIQVYEFQVERHLKNGGITRSGIMVLPR